MQPPLHIVYGTPPRALAPVPADACQTSPYIPGSLALEACAEHSAASATLYAPPGTRERRYTLALTLRTLTEGAPLTALAPKDKGGSRIADELRRMGCTVHEASRQHHRIVTTTRPAQLTDIAPALAEGGMQQHPSHGLWTQPGVFSWDRLDVGSALLLAHLPALHGTGADLGCGLGVLSRAVLTSSAVTSLLLVDIDRRAVEAAKRNITDPRAQFLWADLRSHPPASGLDFIVMNPPFHDTGVEDHSLGQQFIARAASMLKPGGQCWLTANRHLPYEALLGQCFTRVTCIEQADGFKIYEAIR